MIDAQNIQGWVLIITTLTTSIIAIITALKVSKVHTLVNSAATEQRAEIAMLRGLLVSKQLEAEVAEKARQLLASEAAARLAPVVDKPLIVP